MEIRQPISSYTPESLIGDDILQASAKAAGLDTKKLAKNLTVTMTAGAEGAPKKGEAETAPGRIQIEYKDTDQGRAKQVLESIVLRIVEQSEKSNKARLKLVIDSLDLRLPDVKRDLAAAEQALETYDAPKVPPSSPPRMAA
ncbi:MAG: hypothetical protein HC805_06035 [Alkalinema sp. RL_2_19]|nr:hypothetical protein [Alkalinema sp. RL_2_19]